MTWRTLWAVGLVIVGVLLLLSNFNILPAQLWDYFFPAVLIVVGIALLVGVRGRRGQLERVNASAPAEGAARTDMTLKHGAGRLYVHAGSDPTLIFNGNFEGGVDKTVTQNNGTAFVELKTPSDLWTSMSFMNGRGIEWDIALNPTLPTALKYEGGASQTNMDLSGIKLTHLEINTGASSTDIVLPSPSGTVRVFIKTGAASVKLRIPPTAPASIHGTMGMGSLNVDPQRFPNRGSNRFESDNFSNAPDRFEISIEGGVGSVQIN